MHQDSCACGTDSLELFKVPPTNVTLKDSKWMEYYPISSTLDSDTAPIEFEIKGQGDEYLDLSQSYLQVPVNSPRETAQICQEATRPLLT
jgi:hypothetical protein